MTKADPGALGPMLMNGSTDAIVAWGTNIALFADQAKATGNELEVPDIDIPRPRMAHTISEPRFGQLTERLRKHIYAPDAA